MPGQAKIKEQLLSELLLLLAQVDSSFGFEWLDSLQLPIFSRDPKYPMLVV